ncbi:KipI antagonist [Aquimixticola soesokkakensis]|uniref:KipI antagonist n=1 Tax=Aquimixticola soesokkakensis TaxID=1519096 RepID=A0A1Y5RSW3_9RHOB|nr:biotin-dependent carboxyltransferase family protein [Aquimixticola soesokkakensis]SLN23436.1 KipI antagonist [Aquimixticola soesokkakensis]
MSAQARLSVLSAGPLVSVQDLGRAGLRQFGVSCAGAVDAPAARLANALCANAPAAALLEFAGLGGSFATSRDLRFAVTGGACDIRIGARQLPAYESHVLRAGETLRIGAMSDAVWGYLALAGGIDVPCVLGARATHLRTGLGGVAGRCLRAGDQLVLGPASEDSPCLAPGAQTAPDSGPIRLVLGPQDRQFAPEALERLREAVFIVTPQRDRMAMVLDGPPLVAPAGHDIVSDGTVAGVLQVPASGKPIVLLAESQTTGGYPKIATVISADLPRLAQMAVGAQVRFQIIDRDSAEDIAIAARAREHRLFATLRPKIRRDLSSAFLLSQELVGGIFDPDAVLSPPDS